MSVTVYPRNNALAAGDPEVLAQLQAGSPEFFTLNGDILSNVQPEADIQGIPLAFTSSKQVAALNDSEFGTFLRTKLLSKNIQLIPFGCMENGFKQMTSVDRPIRNASDLRGVKMRVPNGKLFIDFYTDLGAVPKIIDFNRLFQALGHMRSLGKIILWSTSRTTTYTKSANILEWAGYNMLANQVFWDRLPQSVGEVQMAVSFKVNGEPVSVEHPQIRHCFGSFASSSSSPVTNSAAVSASVAPASCTSIGRSAGIPWDS